MALGTALVTWAVWPSGGRYLPDPRARQYVAFDACLLTGSTGLAEQASAPVWAGMQRASLKTRAKVSYLAMAGPDTDANARSYVATLAQRRCDLVLVAGRTQVGAVAAQASTLSGTHFVIVGDAPAASNVTAVRAANGADVSASVADIVERAVAASPRS